MFTSPSGLKYPYESDAMSKHATDGYEETKLQTERTPSATSMRIPRSESRSVGLRPTTTKSSHVLLE